VQVFKMRKCARFLSAFRCICNSFSLSLISGLGKYAVNHTKNSPVRRTGRRFPPLFALGILNAKIGLCKLAQEKYERFEKKFAKCGDEHLSLPVYVTRLAVIYATLMNHADR